MKNPGRLLTVVSIIAAAAASCTPLVDFPYPREDAEEDVGEVDTLETDGQADTHPDADAVPDGAEDLQQEDADDGEEADGGPDCGNGVVETGEQCDDGDENSNTEPDHCRLSCQDPGCGDNVTDGGEQCDDGQNGNDADGCTDLCRFTCDDDGDCSDGEICNGEETCTIATHRCAPGTPMEDGFVCNADPRRICLTGSCGLSECGDGFVDTGAGEFCEPSLDPDCRTDCTFECAGPSDCPDDFNVCNGAEYCDMTTNTCDHRDPLADGADCDVNPAVREICLGETCQVSACGDRFTDPGSTPLEECDDGNADNADGCKADCTFTCHVSTQDVECDDGHDCSDDLCDPALHTCGSTASSGAVTCRPASGQPCDVAESCDGTGLDCPPNGFAGSAVECRASAGQCDAAEACNGTSEACPPDLPAADGTTCIDGDSCTLDDICTSGVCAGTFEGDTICNNHGTCNPSGTPPCTCDAGYAGSNCDTCDTGYVIDPATPGRCIPDPCLGVTCSAPDDCNAAYTAVVRTTGACIVLGEGSYQCETVTIACAPGVCSGGACLEAYAPAAGELIISEIMIDPVAVSDDNGQWFEIYNQAGRRIDLSGMIIRTQDSGGSPVELTVPSLPPVLLEPNAHFVVARSSNPAVNGGVTVDLQFATMAFAAATGSISLVAPDGSTVIDTVAWDSSWPIATGLTSGYSMSLSPAALAGVPALLNDTRTHWCYAQAQWSPGADYGSPGAANQACALDWCNLQWPAATSVQRLATTESIFGQVYEPQITDRSDQTPFVTAQVGHGADGTLPDAAWTWFDASYNPGFPPAQNNEEFMGTMTAPGTAGTYDYAYRMSLDGGLSWTTCDRDGSTNGYDPAQSGDMSVFASTLFFSEYIEGSSNNKAVEIYNNNTAALSLDGCLLRLYFNGSLTPSANTISLAGQSVNPGGVFVVCHNLANATILAACNLQSSYLSFNGDDVLELLCGSAPVDIIGQIGVDPGTEWGTGLQSTADDTLVRKCSVSIGDINGADAFDPAAEWDGHAVDTFTYLGSHTTCY